MLELAIREPCMAHSAGRFGYPVQVLPYPPQVKQPYRACFARSPNSRALHGGKRWSICVSCAGTPLYATRKATLPSALCASSQYASNAYRKSLVDLGIQCMSSPIRHPQKNPTERVLRELAIREHFIVESGGQFWYPLQVLPYPSPVKQSCRVRYA
jgi:hypothetical protein